MWGVRRQHTLPVAVGQAATIFCEPLCPTDVYTGVKALACRTRPERTKDRRWPGKFSKFFRSPFRGPDDNEGREEEQAGRSARVICYEIPYTQTCPPYGPVAQLVEQYPWVNKLAFTSRLPRVICFWFDSKQALSLFSTLSWSKASPSRTA